MEFSSRVLAVASHLQAAAASEGGAVIVAPLSAPLPSFYADILQPFAREPLHRDFSQLHGRAFEAATVCCVIAGIGSQLDHTTVDSFLATILAWHGVPPTRGSSVAIAERTQFSHTTRPARMQPIHPPLPPERRVYALVDRASPPASGSRAYAHRAITNADALLAECQRAARAARCVRVRFPPEMPFRDALDALRTANVLVGAHGAGLANAIFLRRGSIVVEVLAASFAVPESFAMRPDKFGFLGRLGLRRVRLVARETALLRCTTHVERARPVFERLRDCDVTIGSWGEVERAIAGAPDSTAAQSAVHRAADEWHPSPSALLSNRVAQLSAWRCTVWPTAQPGTDEARCLRGNQLADGFVYAHNRGRGTSRAVCGAHAVCTCCRRPQAPVRSAAAHVAVFTM